MNKLKRRFFALVLAMLAVLPLCACRPQPQKYEAEFLQLFDTVTKIVAYTDDEEAFARYTQLFYDELEEYHQLYNIYDDFDGVANIKTINDNAGVSPVKVDRRIIDLLLLAKEEYKNTRGQMNVALGAVLRIWHDHRTAGLDDPQQATLPSMQQLRAASEHTNTDDVVIDEAAGTVYLRDAQMSLDVGSLAKGYAVEQVCRYLYEQGFTHALVSVGGNVRAIGGKNSTGEPFRVGVQNPQQDAENPYLHIVSLADMSLVTSGNYERYYIVDGVRYHHLIDPETLFPTTYFTAVTVLCRDSGRADALSTAVFNMPLDEGMAYVDSLDGVEALWVLPGGELRLSAHFDDYLIE
ncbi:MAG: FAD:protein FMN transferase [Eubacteriales bacterium]|nr:FAD:protein FMN transferase [Eubacteriales bacterium]